MKASTVGRAFLLLILGTVLARGNHHGFCCGNCEEEIRTYQVHSCCESGHGGGKWSEERENDGEVTCGCPKNCLTTCRIMPVLPQPANVTQESESERLSVEATMACGLIAGGYAPPTSVNSGRRAFLYIPPKIPLFVPLRV